MSKHNKSRTKHRSGKTTKHTAFRKDATPFQLVFSFLTAPVK
jgi:hypothetical protein